MEQTKSSTIQYVSSLKQVETCLTSLHTSSQCFDVKTTYCVQVEKAGESSNAARHSAKIA